MDASSTAAGAVVKTGFLIESAPGIGFAAVLAAGAVFLYFQHRRLGGSAPPGPRRILAFTRAAVLGAVLFFMLKPTMVRRSLAPLAVRQAVLLDASRSMSLELSGKTSRLDEARGLIRKLQAARELPPEGTDLYVFDDALRPVAAAEIDGIKPEGRRTDIVAALSAAPLDKESGAPLLVFSDGWQSQAAADFPAGIPAVFVDMGGQAPLSNVAVSGLQAADLGFQGKPMDIAASLRNSGAEAVKVPVALKVNNRLVTMRDVTVPPRGEAKTVFEWLPNETGAFQVAVEAKSLEGEAVIEDNRRETGIKVAKDRVRVLFIAGTPTWNYRFLREALKRDPSIDLISFVILRSPTDVIDAPQDEVALIPFPTKKLFNEELGSFDLVIFDNFSYRPYFPPEYLENLKQSVKKGAAFWMWGGPQAFSSGGYQGSPLEEMLPFSLLPASLEKGYIEGSFHGRLTPEGAASPLFGTAQAASEWPALSGYNPVGAARPGSVVLVEHPSRTVSGRPMPLIALAEFGKGRTMAIATDYLWAWDFVAAGRGLGNKLYLDFVKNGIRWLTGDPFLSPLKISFFPQSAAAGDTVTIRVRALDESYRPLSDASVGVTVRTPSGGKLTLKASPTGEAGMHEAPLTLSEEGGYRIEAEAVTAAGRRLSSVEVLEASGHHDEMVPPRGNFLRELADASGGRYLSYRPGAAFERDLLDAVRPTGDRLRLVGEERVSIGSLPLSFALLMIALTLDWWVRKRYRLD